MSVCGILFERYLHEALTFSKLRKKIHFIVGSIVFKEDIVFYDRRHPFMNSKAVIITYDSTARIVQLAFGVYWKSLQNPKVLFAIDSTESAKLSASVLNWMTSQEFEHSYLIRIRRFLEADLWRNMLDNAGLLWAEFYMDLLRLGKDFSGVHDYADRKVILPKRILVKPNMDYFMFLFISYLFFGVIQIIVFLIERWVSDKE